jgi:hypothetical protein
VKAYHYTTRRLYDEMRKDGWLRRSEDRMMAHPEKGQTLARLFNWPAFSLKSAWWGLHEPAPVSWLTNEQGYFENLLSFVSLKPGGNTLALLEIDLGDPAEIFLVDYAKASGRVTDEKGRYMPYYASIKKMTAPEDMDGMELPELVSFQDIRMERVSLKAELKTLKLRNYVRSVREQAGLTPAP